MSVIGIDFGNESCYIAVARQGGIETIANDYSLRATPSYVAFGEKCRVLGVAAKNQCSTNIKNTCYNFKRLIGKHYRDPRVREDLKGLPYRVAEQKDGTIGIVVRYMGEEKTFSPTQLTAMLLTKLKHTAEAALGIKVVDVVIGVPCYFDDAERHAMIEAATAAGLNVLRLMNDTTAVALAYGIYKQDLPAPEEKPRNVVFVDCGQSNLQVSVVAFNKGKLKMLTTVADAYFGGRDFDQLMATHFAAEFKVRYKINVGSNVKAMARLLSEVEKIKKQMSANSTELPLNVECLMDDKDVTGKMKRADLEAMASSLLQRVNSTLNQCLADSGLKLDDIYSVEVVGGSTRVPAIKQIIEKIYKKIPSTTLNADEAIARGCALQCAMLSPTFKVREFSITDAQPHAIKLIWQDESGRESDMEVFPRNHPIPFSKMLTFFRREPFVLQAQYAQPSPSPDPLIGHFTIQDVFPTLEGESQKVKVKVRVNIHGLFTVTSASLTEKKEATEEEAQMEVDDKENPITNGPDNNQQNDTQKQNEEADKKEEDKQDSKMETDKNNEEGNESKNGGDGKGKKKIIKKTIELGVSNVVKCLSTAQLGSLVEQEAQMIQSDKLENERINAKNAVEEYVYDMRSKLYEELEKYITESDRSSYSIVLDDTENWLYDDGEDCAKQMYLDKLSDLKKTGEPIKKRKKERDELPQRFEELMSSIQITKKAILAYKSGDEKYDHLDSAEMEKVEKAVGERESWVEKALGSLTITPLTGDVPVTAQQVTSEKGTFEALVRPIITKPKPKPKTEEPPETTADKDAKTGDAEKPEPTNGEEQSKKSQGPQDQMDVD